MSLSVSQKSDAVVGNTKTTARIATSLYWTFTLNNFSELDFEILKNEICTHCLDYRVQEEIGESGTKHLQGYIHAKKRIRPMESFSNKHIHWEKARSPTHARAYCCKEDTATGNYVLDTVEPLDLIKPDRPWQLSLISILQQKPDDRTIHWYWDSIGCTGKSAFTKYLCAKMGALAVSGKSNDCKYAIVSYHETQKKYPKIIIFDVPRTNIDYLNYEAIESIKNGCFFSGKYECTQVIMNSPHVLIFANTKPQEYKLSIDRWNIIEITMQQVQLNQTSYNKMSSSTIHQQLSH